MKRFAAIFFLCLLLFNIAGYRLWFNYVERKATANLEAAVEQEQYDASELITITVPLSLPYQTDWATWEQVRGEIEVEGIIYHYVQRKVTGGQMMLQCLPNKQQAKIESARDRFFQLANSLQSDHQGKKHAAPNTVKISTPSLTDFDDHWSCWSIAQCMRSVASGRPFVQSLLPQQSLPVPAQPPEFIA